MGENSRKENVLRARISRHGARLFSLIWFPRMKRLLMHAYFIKDAHQNHSIRSLEDLVLQKRRKSPEGLQRKYGIYKVLESEIDANSGEDLIEISSA